MCGGYDRLHNQLSTGKRLCKPVNHWLNMRWDAPGVLRLDVGVAPVGESRDEGVWAYFNHFLTPETQTSTHYFWSVSRPFKLDDESVDR
ncbi:hypothetical protein [Caballeronia novacaledonica]|uniref:hypothetical protein n=1 Tax=Caballeronia novacaledonica TaxID=1544861 RepID=UPI003857740E